MENYQRVLESMDTQSTPNGNSTTSDGAMRNSLSASSNSDFYCKESIVLRPTRGSDDSSARLSPISLRPKSADIGRAGHQKRNSRTLTHVDVPALPLNEPPPPSNNFDHSPANGRRTIVLVHNVGATNGGSCGSADSQTPTPDSQSINGFESEFPTGTIKRQPAATATTPSKILPAYAMGAGHHNARLPLTESTKHIHLAAVLRKHSEGGHGDLAPPSSVNGGRSGSCRSLNDENDSDEEPPPPMPVHAMSQPPSFSALQAEFAAAAEFPPPPSPLPQAHSPVQRESRTPQPLEVKIVENGSSSSSSFLSHNVSPNPSLVSPGYANGNDGAPHVNGKKSALPISPLPPTSPRNGQDAARPKRVPPAPPKRAENTRLSTNGPPPPIAAKPKPAIPAKPKLLAASSAPGATTTTTTTTSPSHRPPSTEEGFSNAFQNELQRAMQKRLQKMEAGSEGGEKTS